MLRCNGDVKYHFSFLSHHESKQFALVQGHLFKNFAIFQRQYAVRNGRRNWSIETKPALRIAHFCAIRIQTWAPNNHAEMERKQIFFLVCKY